MVEVGTPVDITYNRVVVEKTPDDQIAYYIYPDGYGWQNVTAADVNKWLAGYGVADFVTDADVEQKIQASDGNPTYIAKVYPLYGDIHARSIRCYCRGLLPYKILYGRHVKQYHQYYK